MEEAKRRRLTKRASSGAVIAAIILVVVLLVIVIAVVIFLILGPWINLGLMTPQQDSSPQPTQIIINVSVPTSTSVQPTCNYPYVLIGNTCCIDNNHNGVCDSEEATPVNTQYYNYNYCSPGYIRDGDSCCLDSNNDGRCDIYQQDFSSDDYYYNDNNEFCNGYYSNSISCNDYYNNYHTYRYEHCDSHGENCYYTDNNNQ